MAIKLIDDKNLRDVADAIRAKNGTSIPLEFPDDFVDAIEGLPETLIMPLAVSANGSYTAPSGTAYSPVTVNVSGGGSASVPAKEVNFRDYDGTVVNAYTAAEFLALESMPANPDHTADGLTAQGWNWSFADAQSYVQNYGRLEVGQMYVPTDGKTHLFIHIDDSTPVGRRDFQVRYTQTVSEGVTIDWGDGSEPETFTGTSAANHAHTYADPGDYEITLEVTSGTVSFVGSNTTAIYGPYDNPHAYYRTRIIKAQIGNDVTAIGTYALQYCYALTSITIPNGVTSIRRNAFYSCYALTSITIPSGVTNIGNNTFQNCYALTSITIPSGVTSIDSTAFANCYTFTSITIPSGVTSISGSVFSGGYALTSVTIPSGVTKIGDGAFQACYGLFSVTIPSGVNTINSSAFIYCYSLAEIHFLPTTPPTVSKANAFTGIPTNCKIYVPTGSLEAYTTATNYPSSSTYTYIEE